MLRKYSAIPYVFWSAVFIVIPLLLVAGYSITSKDPNTGEIMFTLENFQKFMDPLYLKVLWRSIKLAGEATIICLVLGYPMAMILAKMPPKTQRIAALLFVLPMWMNFLLRTYAWMFILGKTGIVNRILMFFLVFLQASFFTMKVQSYSVWYTTSSRLWFCQYIQC